MSNQLFSVRGVPSFLHFICGVCLLPSAIALADKPPTWSPEKAIPRIRIVGPSTPGEVEMAEKARAWLLDSLGYWQVRGLPEIRALDGIYYIPHAESLTADVLAASMNPEIADIRAHAKTQYEALLSSSLGRLTARIESEITTPEDKNKIRAQIDELFDGYAALRYGVAVNGAYQRIQEGGKFKGTELDRLQDNAYYARNTLVDLSEVLAQFDASPAGKKAASAVKGKPEAAVNEAISAVNHLLIELIGKGSRTAREIIILPRGYQKAGETSMSTLQDRSVSVHELGHHVNSQLSQDQGLHRLLEEVYADFFASSSAGDPKIGAFFAKASAIVAQRVLEDGEVTSADLMMAHTLNRTASTGFLRDMADTTRVNVDLLDRKHTMANDYDAGHPLRSLLWRIRQNPEVNRAQLESAFLRTAGRIHQYPILVTGDGQTILMIRRGLLFVSKLLSALKKETKKSDPEEEKLSSEEKTARDFERAKAKLAAEAAQENSARKWRDLLQKVGLSNRAPIEADYVIPTFLRLLHQEALKESPQLAMVVREQAERVMNSRSEVITTELGHSYLFFHKLPWNQLNPLLKLRIHRIFREMEGASIFFHLTQGFPEEKEWHERQAERFSKAHDQLIQFERTGNPIRLFWAYPSLKLAQKSVDGLLKALGGASSERDSGSKFIRCLVDRLPKLESER